MKLDAIERFDIKAEAFRIMTGHMAPGKDVSALGWSEPHEVREAEWSRWCEAFNACANAMLTAVDRILPDREEA